MAENDRMASLKAAWDLLDSADQDEQRKLFGHLVENLENHKQQLKSTENRFHPHSSLAFSAMSEVRIFFQRLTGYNIGWVAESYAEHCTDRSGRPPKYNLDTRESDCFFITQMTMRGSSETQAMKLLMRLKGDAAMSQGHMRELQDTYRQYKALGRPSQSDKSIRDRAYIVADFLKFDVSKLEGSERASLKSVGALRSFFQELIDFMKSSHRLVASRDSDYPDVFGPVIDWLKLKYDDPLDYFYGPHIDSGVDYHTRRKGLLEYLNTAFFFQEEYGKKGAEESFFHSREN